MPPSIPNSKTPKVAATAVGGNVAVVLAWFWNKSQMVEVCTPNELSQLVCVMEPGEFYLIEPIYGFVIANLAWVIGPLMRMYQDWADKRLGNGNHIASVADKVDQLADVVGALATKVDSLVNSPPK